MRPARFDFKSPALFQYPSANLLWRNLHVRDVKRTDGKPQTQNVRIDIIVDGVSAGKTWSCGLEFDYANEESFYCRPLRPDDGKQPRRMAVPTEAADSWCAFLPPMSGLTDREFLKQPGEIVFLIGQGETAQVLRNLCYQLHQKAGGQPGWTEVCAQIRSLFGVVLQPPQLLERAEITMAYHDSEGTLLDLSSAGRGLQQTLLLLAHLYANPKTVLLLDEPDAHLEVLRQRQIYQLLTEVASLHGSQIIAGCGRTSAPASRMDTDFAIALPPLSESCEPLLLSPPPTLPEAYRPRQTKPHAQPVSHLFVDFENVTVIDLAMIGHRTVTFTLLLGPLQKKLEAITVEKLLEYGTSVQLFRLTSAGRNALDFVLVYYLGRAVAASPTDSFHIISKDKGFDPLIEHLRSKQVLAYRHDGFAALHFPDTGVSKARAPLTQLTGARVQTKPTASPPSAAQLESQVVTHLRGISTNRPRTRARLENYLYTYFGRKVGADAVSALVDGIGHRRLLSIDDAGGVTYHL